MGYAVGVVSAALALGVRLALGDMALKFPFLLFLPPVVVTIFVGGLLPGILSVVLVGIVA